VERIASGKSHNDRVIAQIVLVDQDERLVFQAFIKPQTTIVSYLKKLTGLSEGIVNTLGIKFNDAIGHLKTLLDPSTILVGHNVREDVNSLDLQQGRDYSSMMDLLGLYRLWNSRCQSFSVWEQDRLATVLLGWPNSENYSATSDALKTLRLFQLYFMLQNDISEWNRAFQLLVNTPAFPPWFKIYPAYEGVCMGNRRYCICGCPFLS
jgi:RNA exonuclease 4